MSEATPASATPMSIEGVVKVEKNAPQPVMGKEVHLTNTHKTTVMPDGSTTVEAFNVNTVSIGATKKSEYVNPNDVRHEA